MAEEDRYSAFLYLRGPKVREGLDCEAGLKGPAKRAAVAAKTIPAVPMEFPLWNCSAARVRLAVGSVTSGVEVHQKTFLRCHSAIAAGEAHAQPAQLSLSRFVGSRFVKVVSELRHRDRKVAGYGNSLLSKYLAPISPADSEMVARVSLSKARKVEVNGKKIAVPKT